MLECSDYSGTLDRWNAGMLECLNTEIQKAGKLESWSVQIIPGRLNAGMLECWNAGTMLECWNVRSLERGEGGEGGVGGP